MVVPPKHPKMIIFSRKPPWLLGKPTILGNSHMNILELERASDAESQIVKNLAWVDSHSPKNPPIFECLKFRSNQQKPWKFHWFKSSNPIDTQKKL